MVINLRGKGVDNIVLKHQKSCTYIYKALVGILYYTLKDLEFEKSSRDHILKIFLNLK